MRHGSLFTGIGGFDLASTWMGWNNVFQCEKDTFCRKVLKHYWPTIPIYNDIYHFNASKYYGTIDILSAGFPCQPFSIAGKKGGQIDNRNLWPETFRIIKEIRPRWLVLENVTGLFTILEPSCPSEMEIQSVNLFCKNELQKPGKIIHKIQQRIIGRIISDIRSEGYHLPRLGDGTPIVLRIPACAVNAPHRRDRVWIIAYADSSGLERRKKSKNPKKTRSKKDKYLVGLSKCKYWENWTSEFPFSSSHDGIPTGLDGITFPKFRNESLKAFGNAVVPQLVLKLFKAIYMSEKMYPLEFK